MRYPDGTQICWGLTTIYYFNVGDLNGGLYFPAVFAAATISVMLTPTPFWSPGPVRNYSMTCRVNNVTPNVANVSASNDLNNNQPGDQLQLFFIAIGRWF